MTTTYDTTRDAATGSVAASAAEFAAEFTIAHDHPCLPGHFPGRPVVPGVVVLDRVLDVIEGAHGPLPAPLRLPQAKFVRPLLPDETAIVRIAPQPPAADGARRWKFRVLLATCGDAADAASNDTLLASGDVALPATEPMP